MKRIDALEGLRVQGDWVRAYKFNMATRETPVFGNPFQSDITEFKLSTVRTGAPTSTPTDTLLGYTDLVVFSSSFCACSSRTGMRVFGSGEMGLPPLTRKHLEI